MSLFIENNTGLFVGSDTGNTDEIAEKLVNMWTISDLELINADDMKLEDFDRFDFIILGLSTWYDGELQSGFESFYEQFKTIDFTGKIVALFGVGDQTGYPQYFVDGIGILGEIVVANGGQIIGLWPIEEYDFDESKGLYDESLFYGLALDFENQMDMNVPRLKAWLSQIEEEVGEMINA